MKKQLKHLKMTLLTLAFLAAVGSTAPVFATDYELMTTTSYGGGGGGSWGGGGGNGDVVAAATGGFVGLDCSDCGNFVRSVYRKAGLPEPLMGSSFIGPYRYNPAYFTVVQNPAPGDVVVWGASLPNGFAGWGHVAIYLSNNFILEVAEGGGGDRTNVPSSCKIGGAPWWPSPTFASHLVGYLRYTGS